jgi:hypothetical protein
MQSRRAIGGTGFDDAEAGHGRRNLHLMISTRSAIERIADRDPGRPKKLEESAA